MNDPFHEIAAALYQAELLQRAVRVNADRMGRMLVGNLYACDHTTLARLKRDIQRYNIHTRRWREPK